MSRNTTSRSSRTMLVAVLAIGAFVVTFGGFKLFDIGLPFSQESKDHSPPLILQEIRDLAEFHAGQAEFEIIIDRENDVKWVPSFLAGDRVQFVAVGTVDATVDFATMSADSVIYDEETNSATVILPAPTIDDPVVDMDRSGVMNRDRGVLDRLGGVFSDNPTSEVGLIQEAEEKMAAAVAETDLLATAQRNTTTMLVNLINALGIDNVRVVFDGGAPVR